MKERFPEFMTGGCAIRSGTRWLPLLLAAWMISLISVQGAVAPEATPGESVLIVYNSRMPESKLVADEYARKRQVPANQILGLPLPLIEEMTRREYFSLIEGPVLEKLETGGYWVFSGKRPKDGRTPGAKPRRLLQARIRYVVLCYGVPSRIKEDAGWKETVPKDLQQELRFNRASVDSDLACLPLAYTDMNWTGPIRNPTYATTNTVWLHPTNGILLVARLDGPSPELARSLVNRALTAETNGLWGRAYFDTRSLTNGPYQIGDQMISAMAHFCRTMGMETIMETNETTFPPAFVLSDVAVYAGWYAPGPTGPLAQPTVDFVPGAFAYHLHSMSAYNIRSRDANWVGPLIQRGAAATVGYVDEPYLALTLDLPAFILRWLYGGFTLGEAAWASSAWLSWQTVILGDPLYRPFTRPLPELHQDLEKRKRPELAWSHLMVLNRNLLMKAPFDEALRFLDELPMTATNAVLTEKQAELFLVLNDIPKALDTLEQALKRHPTPPQKLRLALRLAEWRAALAPDDKALLSCFRIVFDEFPAHGDRAGLCQRMLPLAQRTGDSELAAQVERELKRLAK